MRRRHSSLSKMARGLLAASLGAFVLAGCASSPPQRTLSKEVPPYATLPNGQNPFTGEQVLHNEGAALERLHGRPLQVLMLSGGGQNGAFGAGVLKGWTGSGERPVFDGVTGISTGALMATFAYLGEPQDDETLAALYTGITADDIYEKGGGVGRVLFGGSSLMETAPLKRLIDKHVTEETLARVAAQHARGRLLVVGATNLDTNQLWVFLLSKLAHDGGPDALETYRKILLAAASPPVVFPPVEIYGHLFADGATVSNLLIVGLAGKTARFPDSVPRGGSWVIHNGRLTGPAEAEALQPTVFSVLGRTLTIAMDAQMGGTLVRTFAVARTHDYDFRLLHVPDEVEMGGNALAFDPDEMRRLYDAGRALGRQPDSWQNAPPATQEISPTLLQAMRRLPPLMVE